MEMFEIVHASPFYEMAAILLLAALAGFLALKLKQPLLVSFIAVGVLAGPDALGFVGYDDSMMETLSQLGIALLLFMVGLKLDIGVIKKLGPIAVSAGMAQISVCALLGGGIALAMGYDPVESGLIGLALAFSSTIIVVKLLSDKRAIDALYGRMALGILIVQDIVVILATIVLSAGAAEGTLMLEGTAILMIAAKLIAVVLFAGLFIRYIAEPLSGFLGQSPELMVIFAIGYAGFAAAVCSYVGLSKELGGLIAGITLASTSLNNIMSSRLTALRDFLLLFFFVSLGAKLNLDSLGSIIAPVIIFTLFAMLLKPFIIMIITEVSGYRARTGFLTGLTLGQISEFSMILVVMAQAGNFVGAEIVDIITLVGIVSMGLSTYSILNDNQIYQWVEERIPLFQRASPTQDTSTQDPTANDKTDIIIYGLGRYGSALAKQFQRQGLEVLAVDFDPDAIRRANEMGIKAIYGDAADPDFPKYLPLQEANTIVMAFHHHLTGPMTADDRKTLARSLRHQGYTGHIAATLNYTNIESGRDLAHHGVDIILEPYADAAYHGAEKILQTMGLDIASAA